MSASPRTSCGAITLLHYTCSLHPTYGLVAFLVHGEQGIDTHTVHELLGAVGVLLPQRDVRVDELRSVLLLVGAQETDHLDRHDTT